jgi:hypothetical protein
VTHFSGNYALDLSSRLFKIQEWKSLYAPTDQLKFQGEKRKDEDHSRRYQITPRKQENGHQNRPRALPTTSQLISCSKEKSDLKMNIIQEEAGLIPSKKIINKGA